MTWHPELQQLVFSPLAEQAALRGKLLGNASGLALKGDGVAVPLFDAAKEAGAGKQSEVQVEIALPSEPTVFAVTVKPTSPSDLYSRLLGSWRL